MIAFERLASLALGELDDDAAAEVEEHVLGCSRCAAVLESLLELGDRLAEVARSGTRMLAGRALVDRLAAAGLVTRTYSIAAGGQVACTVDDRDLYSAMRLSADTRGERRVDVVFLSPERDIRYEDVPFEPDGVVFVHPAHYLRTIPSGRKMLRLVAVDDQGDRVLAEYVLNHTAPSSD
jgi:hypothetical protein